MHWGSVVLPLRVSQDLKDLKPFDAGQAEGT